jgi:TetR/AcrR family transcriptional regulator
MRKNHHAAREQIFAAALDLFAERGYAGASLQDIVSAARLTKPTLYYYFKSKEGLFNALLEYAYQECFDRMQSAVARTTGVEEQLTEILASLFHFFGERRHLTRLAFSSAFAAPGEMPVSPHIKLKRRRNFEFVHGVIKQGLADGALDRRLNSRELTYGIYGALSYHVMANLLLPGTRLNRTTAKRVVALFMNGARSRGSNENPHRERNIPTDKHRKP